LGLALFIIWLAAGPVGPGDAGHQSCSWSISRQHRLTWRGEL
jgi:hypothetical protein